MEGIKPIDYINLVGSISSLILAIVAIWLSVQFYFKTKEAELRADSSLTGIKAQADALQKLSGRMLDRYTTYATTAKPADESFILLARILQQGIPLQQGVDNTVPDVAQQQESKALTEALVESYIAITYHAGVANITLQGSLPSEPADLNEMQWVRRLVDSTNGDFHAAKQWLDSFEDRTVENSRLKWMYDEAVLFEDGVKDAMTYYQTKDQE